MFSMPTPYTCASRYATSNRNIRSPFSYAFSVASLIPVISKIFFIPENEKIGRVPE